MRGSGRRLGFRFSFPEQYTVCRPHKQKMGVPWQHTSCDTTGQDQTTLAWQHAQSPCCERIYGCDASYCPQERSPQRIKPFVRVGQLQKGCPNKSCRAALSQGNAAKENTCSNGASVRRSASGASVLARMASLVIESTLHRRLDGIGRRENVVDPFREGLLRYDDIVFSIAWVD